MTDEDETNEVFRYLTLLEFQDIDYEQITNLFKIKLHKLVHDLNSDIDNINTDNLLLCEGNTHIINAKEFLNVINNWVNKSLDKIKSIPKKIGGTRKTNGNTSKTNTRRKRKNTFNVESRQ